MSSTMLCRTCGRRVKVPTSCDHLELSGWYCLRCRGGTLQDIAGERRMLASIGLRQGRSGLRRIRSD